MKTPLITFVLGAIAGALGMFLASSPKDEPLGETTPREERPPLRAFPENDEKKIARLEKKIAELEAAASPEVADGDDGEEKPGIVKVFGAGGKSQIDLTEIREQMAKSEKERTEKLVNSRLATLTAKLNLTDEQAQKVRALLEKEASTKSGGISQLLTTAMSGDGEAALDLVVGETDSGEDGFDFGSELQSLLDDDQNAAYAKHIEAQNENAIEASANGKLASLQTNIPDLSKEQKDRAFEAFARIAREDIEANGAPQNSSLNMDFGRQMQTRSARSEAMEEILTPEQYEVYSSNNSSTITFGGTGAGVITTGVTIESSEIIIDNAEDSGE